MTEKNTLEVRLRGLRYEAALSEETPCFSASLYLNGKRRGTVSNHGQGGPHSFSERAAELELNEWAKSQPPLKVGDRELAMDGELYLSCLVDDVLTARDRKHMVRRLIKRLKRTAREAELIVVGVRTEGRQLTAVGDCARRERVGAVIRQLAEEEGCDGAFEVYNVRGILLEKVEATP